MATFGSKGFTFTKLHKIQAAAVGVLIVGTVVAAVQVTAPKPTTPLCEQRYTGGVLFSLSRASGIPLQPEDIQARLGGLDWGITTNTRIVKDEAVPYGYAMEISLKRVPDAGGDRSGMGFTWLPRQLATASAACLSYSFWVPPDFRNGDGGTLPGFVSEPPNDSSGADSDDNTPPRPPAKPFSIRTQWSKEGRFQLAYSVNNGQTGQIVIDSSKAHMKPGRWVRIEEEIVLNTPGRNDGILRVYIDRQLMIERMDVTYRVEDVQNIQGVVGDTHYARNGVWQPPPVNTQIKLSPLELRLR